MQRLQAYKYTLMPDGQQKRDMSRFAGSCRFVYNKALALQQERYAAGEKKHSYAALCKLLTQWRASTDTSWLADSPTHPLQQSLKDLERAYTNFFAKRTDFPRFKRKGMRDSFRYPDAKQIKLDEANNRIYLPKLGWMRYRNSRKIEGKIRNATVSLKAGRWFVSIQTEREVEGVQRDRSKIVGLDMGIKRFVTLSDGTYVDPLNSFKRLETALRKAQQALSRKKKRSKNWYKALRKIQRLHAKIANVRHDFLHKLSTLIAESQGIVCAEDLQVKNMSKSASGTVETPGRQVSQKRGLNKAILDQGWGTFIRMLGYKLDWAGGGLVLVPPQYTSQTCPTCGHIAHDNRKTQAMFECVACGYAGNADHIAAMNILNRGMALLLRRSSTEPERGTRAIAAHSSLLR